MAQSEEKLAEAEKMMKKADKLNNSSWWSQCLTRNGAADCLSCEKYSTINHSPQTNLQQQSFGQYGVLLWQQKRMTNNRTKLSFTRWKAEWNTATPLYEQAALTFRFAKENAKAKEAYEKAATGQERLSSPWQAAKHFESAGALAKELENWNEVADFYKRACELYTECGKPQPASDALARGARALEDAVPDESVRMYIDSCGILEDEGKEQMAFDTYRAVTNLYLKLERFSDAATILLRWGLAADKCKAINSQCKAYLSAIIVYLYAHDIKQAEQCYNDCSQIYAFFNSEQNYCAEKLLQAYREADVEEIKHIAQSNSAISHLDHMIVRLARKLPTGDVNAVPSSSATEEEPLNENDLT